MKKQGYQGKIIELAKISSLNHLYDLSPPNILSSIRKLNILYDLVFPLNFNFFFIQMEFLITCKCMKLEGNKELQTL